MIGTCLGALQRTFSLYRSQRVMPWHQSIASALNGSSQTALSISEQIWSETSSVGKDQMKQPPQPELRLGPFLCKLVYMFKRSSENAGPISINRIYVYMYAF